MKTTKLLSSVLLLGLVGCYTFSETEFPEVSITPVPAGKKVSVRLRSFRTGVFDKYIPVEGHETMIPGGDAKDDAVLAQDADIDVGLQWYLGQSPSVMVVVRSLNELKRKGYTIAPKDKRDFVIQATFSGPEFYDQDMWRVIGTTVCTLAMYEKNEVTWRAKMQVLDSTGEKVLLEKEYEQHYEASFGGPCPICSTAMHPMALERGVNSWAITALNDRLMADATAFIVKQLK